MNKPDRARSIVWAMEEIEDRESGSGSRVIFTISARPIDKEPYSPTDQARALEKLEIEKAIRILDVRCRRLTYGKDFDYSIEILRPRFDELLLEQKEGIAGLKSVSSPPVPHSLKIPRNYITKNSDGGFSYLGRPIIANESSLYFRVFSILYEYCGASGDLSYADIDRYLAKAGYPAIKENSRRNKRIRNALAGEQGFLAYAKVGGASLGAALGKDQKLISFCRGRGLRLNNLIGP